MNNNLRNLSVKETVRIEKKQHSIDDKEYMKISVKLIIVQFQTIEFG